MSLSDRSPGKKRSKTRDASVSGVDDVCCMITSCATSQYSVCCCSESPSLQTSSFTFPSACEIQSKRTLWFNIPLSLSLLNSEQPAGLTNSSRGKGIKNKKERDGNRSSTGAAAVHNTTYSECLAHFLLDSQSFSKDLPSSSLSPSRVWLIHTDSTWKQERAGSTACCLIIWLRAVVSHHPFSKSRLKCSQAGCCCWGSPLFFSGLKICCDVSSSCSTSTMNLCVWIKGLSICELEKERERQTHDLSLCLL